MNLLILSIIIIIIIIIINNEYFYPIVIGIAIIMVVIVLSIVAYYLQGSKKNKVFPPITSDCPDHWVADDLSGCLNPLGLGSCPGPENFNTHTYNTHDGNCKKSKWAESCGLTWQGITTNEDICNDW